MRNLESDPDISVALRKERIKQAAEELGIDPEKYERSVAKIMTMTKCALLKHRLLKTD